MPKQKFSRYRLYAISTPARLPVTSTTPPQQDQKNIRIVLPISKTFEYWSYAYGRLQKNQTGKKGDKKGELRVKAYIPPVQASADRPGSTRCAWTGIRTACGTRRDSALAGEERCCDKASCARGAEDISRNWGCKTINIISAANALCFFAAAAAAAAAIVPALSYGAPADSDVSSPPAGTFLLPESGVIVGFVASLFPSIDYKDVTIRAKAALAQAQYESLAAPHWGQLQRQGGKSEDFDAVVTGLKNWSAALPEEILGEEYGVADALLGPFVTRLFLFSQLDVGVWPAGTGPKLLSAISGPEYAKLHKFAKKLQGWSAITETVDEDALVVRFREFFKNT
ncbi:hypothetical protein FIBSPDRAFT_986255 [Athelia psychrophila]|uniref:GST C-terminal domain-containing protein n=1 Tax=Athelia psychrophila TaxID=1759441 RepID=A0A166AX47_9AGAM|nr:hypothetical protein FIBSPDRAFT_986255 [Fibularhizoctonia sp. CBS 109695]